MATKFLNIDLIESLSHSKGYIKSKTYQNNCTYINNVKIPIVDFNMYITDRLYGYQFVTKQYNIHIKSHVCECLRDLIRKVYKLGANPNDSYFDIRHNNLIFKKSFITNYHWDCCDGSINMDFISYG